MKVSLYSPVTINECNLNLKKEAKVMSSYDSLTPAIPSNALASYAVSIEDLLCSVKVGYSYFLSNKTK